MEKEKSKNGVIALLVVIIIILAILCILFATGTISFKSNVTENKNESQEINEIDEETLQKLLPIIGINNDKLDKCDYISLTLLRNNSLSNLSVYETKELMEIIYLFRHSKNYEQPDNYVDTEKCIKTNETAIPGGSCYQYSKQELKEISDNYFFPYTVEEVFKDAQNEDENNYYSFNDLAGYCAGYDKYKHNISSWYGLRNNKMDNKNIITIKDNLQLEYYDTHENTSKIIYYTFELNDNNYKLTDYKIY